MAQVMKRNSGNNTPTLNDMHQFVLERFMEIKDMGDLVKFQSINKYLIMAHSPKHLNILGNIVANHNGLSGSEVLKEYQVELKNALSCKPTTKSHYNTLQHILGHFSPDLTQAEKGYFLGILQNFKENKAELNDALKILKDCTAKYDKSYLSRQTYFLFFTNPQYS